MAINTKKYIENYLKIKTKDSQIVPFILNKPQMKLYEAIKSQVEAKKPVRIIILKARQMGFSTVTEAIIFKRTATKRNVSSGIVAHVTEATNNLYTMSKLFLSELPNEWKPQVKASNAKELIFNNKEGTGLRSKIKCMTAGSTGLGRSDTFQNLHISEYAFWKGDKQNALSGLLQAVPTTPESMVIIESTANGYEDFKERWDKAVAGESDYIPVFCAWHELESYRLPVEQGFTLTEEEKELKELYKLDNEQIAWRRWQIANGCKGDINMFRQEYPSCPEEAFLTSGNCIFDKDQVIKRIEQLRNLSKENLKHGYFKYRKKIIDVENYEIDHASIQFVEDKNGYITIYHEPTVIYQDKIAIKKAPYVIGADTAGKGEDYFTAQVVNCITQETHATLHKKLMDEDLFADQLYCLGIYYHEAMIGVEINYSIVADRELNKLNYPNIFQSQVYNKQDQRYRKSTGYMTTSITRPVMIAKLQELYRTNIAVENDIETLKECLTFIKNSKGRAEAEQGYHDDLVMARAIAGMVLEQQDCNWIEIERKEEELPLALQSTRKRETDILEEYLNEMEFDDWEEF